METQIRLEWVSQAHTDIRLTLPAVPGAEEYFQAQLNHQSQEGQGPSRQQSSVPAAFPAITSFTALQPL